MTIHIVSGADESYALGLVVALRSAVEHLRGETAQLVVLDLGLSAATVRALCSAAEDWPNLAGLEVVRPDTSRFERLPTPAHFITGNYARLLLPDLVTSRTALYLDADVVTREDVGPLVRTPLPRDSLFAASRDLQHPTLGEGLPTSAGASGDPYFNSGVMVMDLASWRREGAAGAVLEWMTRNHASVRYVDQDGINAVLSTRGLPLPASWNVQTNPLHALLRNPSDSRRTTLDMTPEEMIDDARIVHFVGGKPWDGSSFQANPLSVRANIEWWQVLSASGFLPRHRVVRTAARALPRAVRHARAMRSSGRRTRRRKP